MLITHYMQEAERLSDRIGIMKNGSLLALGTADELKKKTATDSVENAFIKIVKAGRAMRCFKFSQRCINEILRDPLNLCFGLGFPIVLLALLSAIQANIPVSLFEIVYLTSGVSVFGLAFMSLFTATLMARDRESALMQRLYTTPLSALDFILGYALPIIPISVAQTAVCCLFACFLGLEIKLTIVTTLLFTVPNSLLFIAFGLLLGSILNVKQVGGICGALLTNVTAFLSGIWFDLNLVGDAFKRVAQALPFYHAVELARRVYE